MVMPWDAAKPLNSFLNSRSTLKFSDFALSIPLPSSPSSVCRLANGHPLAQ